MADVRLHRNTGSAAGSLITGAALAAGALLLPACSGLDALDDEELSTESEALYPASSKIWQQLAIPVCWENPTDATARGWVRTAVEGTWEASSRVDFTGWGTCTAGARGIRIQIDDSNALVWALGRDLDGLQNGMVLNFTFANWNQGCQGTSRQFCIQAIAIHEFGHALGFAHEHNRPDTPSSCTDAPQGSNGDTTVGAWDPDSVMNYCAPYRTTLSAGDITGVRQYYGSPAFSSNRKAATEWDNGKVYFFNGPQYTRYDLATGKTDSGFPRQIADHWGNWPAAWTDGIDAAIHWGNGKAYLFRGSQYVRYDVASSSVDPGYPKSTALYWAGWPQTWTSIDAAVMWPTGKAYFFRGSEYIRFDVATDRVDIGPRSIATYWPGMFPSTIDDGVTTGTGKAYFFKGTQYVRYDITYGSTDAGYPRLIAGNWPGVPF